MFGQSLGGIIVQLAAHYQGHDDRADSGGAACAYAARIGAHIPLAERIHQDITGIGLYCIVAADPGCHQVIGQSDDGSNACACSCSEGGRCRHTDESVVILRIQGDAACPDHGLCRRCIVLHDSQHSILIEDDHYRAGNSRSAAAGNTCTVSSDKFPGVGQNVQFALGIHTGTCQQDCFSESLERGDHRHAGHTGSGGTRNAQGHIVKFDDGIGSDVHIAAVCNLPAQMGLHRIFICQDVARSAGGCSTSGDAEGGGQQEHLIGAVGIHSDGLFRVDCLAAAQQDRRYLLFKQDGDYRTAQDCGSAAGGIQCAAEVHHKGIVSGFNRDLAFPVGIIRLTVAIYILLLGGVQSGADPAVVAHMSVDGIVYQQCVGHTHQVCCGGPGHRTSHCRHINLFGREGMEHHAPPPVLSVGCPDTCIGTRIQCPGGKVIVFTHQSLHQVPEDNGGGTAAQSCRGTAGTGHCACTADHQIVCVSQNTDAVPGLYPAVVTQAGDSLAGKCIVDIGTCQVQRSAAGEGQGRARSQRAVVGSGFHQHFAVVSNEGSLLCCNGGVFADTRTGMCLLAELPHQNGGTSRSCAAAGSRQAQHGCQQIAVIESVEQHIACHRLQYCAAASQSHSFGTGGKIRQCGRRICGTGRCTGGRGQNFHHPVRTVSGEGYGGRLDHGVIAHTGTCFVMDIGPGHSAAYCHIGTAGSKAHIGCDKRQLEVIVCVHSKGSIGVDGNAISHRGQRRSAALYQVKPAAQCQEGRTSDRIGSGHVPHQISGSGCYGHVSRCMDSTICLTIANPGFRFILQLCQRHHRSRARLGGTQAGGAGDNPSLSGRIRPYSQAIALVILAQGKRSAVADGSQHTVFSQQLGYGTRHIGSPGCSMVQTAGDSLYIIVYSCQIVDHIQQIQQVVCADGTLHLDLADMRQIVRHGDVHEALVGLTHGGILIGNREQVAPVEGELVHTLVHQRPIGGNGEGVCFDGEAVTDLRLDVAEGVQHGKGRANAHRLCADVGTQSADGQLAQVFGSDEHIAACLNDHVVAQQGQGIGLVSEHSHGTGHPQRALHTGGDGSRHGLGAHIAGIIAGEVLSGVSSDRDILCRLQGHAAAHIGLSGVLVEGHRHGSCHDVGSHAAGHGGAGCPVAEVDHVLGLGLHVAPPGCHIAQNPG